MWCIARGFLKFTLPIASYHEGTWAKKNFKSNFGFKVHSKKIATMV